MAEVYSTQIKGITFKYRGPSRSELRHYETFSNGNQYEFQERIIVSCVLDPIVTFDETTKEEKVNLSISPFNLGDISLLAKTIIYNTGYHDPDMFRQHLTWANEYASSEEGRLDALSLASIPGLNPLELWNMEPSDMYKVYALAGLIAPSIGINTDVFLNPEKFTEEISKAERQQRLVDLNQKAMARLGNTGGFGKNPRNQIEVEDSRTFST